MHSKQRQNGFDLKKTRANEKEYETYKHFPSDPQRDADPGNVGRRNAAHGSAPTEPSEEPTEPSTEPGTQPEEEPTVPAPTQPQTPAGNENAGGISWWIVLIVAIVCYTGGILMDHLLLHKK